MRVIARLWLLYFSFFPVQRRLAQAGAALLLLGLYLLPTSLRPASFGIMLSLPMVLLAGIGLLKPELDAEQVGPRTMLTQASSLRVGRHSRSGI